MGNRIKQIKKYRPQPYWGGFFVLGLLCSLYSLALGAVFFAGEQPWQSLLQEFYQDPYVHQVLSFSFMQASLSALFSVGLGWLFARALFYQPFFGKALLLRLFSLTFVLPSLVVIFGLLGIYGSSGWLAQLARFCGFHWQPNIYGLGGILLAHLFFNIPLATRLFLQSLQAIPNQQRQLAAQLGISGWQFIRLIEFPYAKQQILPAFVFIFTLCFTSFSIVLTLGGSPKYTSLEVAIYQAIMFDFDLSKAAFFALLQFVLCFVLFAVSSLFSPMPETQLNQRYFWVAAQKRAVVILQVFLIGLLSLFLLLPLCNIVFSALFSGELTQLWRQPQLWQSLGYSAIIAPLSATLSLMMSSALLLLARRLTWHYYQHLANLLLNTGMLVLSVPMLLFAIGLFLFLQQWDLKQNGLLGLVILCNALTAMPFVIRILSAPMKQNMQYYEKLCQALNIQGWQRFRLIEWHNLANPIKYAFALACCISLGDFTAIALFGSQHFSSLPYLLYEQLGSYRGNQAAVTAFVLLLFCFVIFMLAERYKQEEKDD